LMSGVPYRYQFVYNRAQSYLSKKVLPSMDAK
jgi:hypothetical protein